MRRPTALAALAPLVTLLLAPAAAAAPAAGAAAAAPLEVRVTGVDVSQRPRIGLVVTVPGAAPAVPDVHADGADGQVWVRPLSPADLAVVVVPDPAATNWPSQRLALIRFLLALPVEARAEVADGLSPAAQPRRDLLAAVQRAAELGPGPGRPAYDRLLEALDALPADRQSRRVVVLASRDDLPADPAFRRYLQGRLAASGTALYLLDLSPGGLPALAELAAGSGGRALTGRGRVPPEVLRPAVRDLASQYRLTFDRRLPLPGTDRLLVTVAGRSRIVPVVVPASDPVPPAGPPPMLQGRPDLGLEAYLPLVAGLLVVVGVGYGVGMLLASRRSPRNRVRVPVPTDDLFFVFVLPCLNEERVIRASLDRLAAIPSDNHAALVIDDGSDDGTAELVGRIAGERVWLLRRTAPNARQGKGEALNAAVRHLLESGRLAGRDPDQVIIAVVDADGRLDPHALTAVSPFFADPAVGGVQIGVRINNRTTSLLARLQDMEFLIYTDVFQRGRRHLGSVGMGGNGQFMRLSALLSLMGSTAEGPWTRSLTEDLDLGIRLLNLGWRNEFCRHAAVHQQGVTELRRLVRQRSRWFQGHLQSWRLVPSVLASAPRLAAPDLVYHLTSPALLLIGSLLTMSFLLSMVAAGGALLGGLHVFGWWVLTTYTLSFGPALTYTGLYWWQERANGLRLYRAVGLAHLYVGYGLVWAAAGWWGLIRQLRGRTGWAKTERLVEAPPVTVSGGPT